MSQILGVLLAALMGGLLAVVMVVFGVWLLTS